MRKLVMAAHELCPYSRAIKGNVVSRCVGASEGTGADVVRGVGGRDQGRGGVSLSIGGCWTALLCSSDGIVAFYLALHGVRLAPCVALKSLLNLFAMNLLALLAIQGALQRCQPN